jgi:nicotinamidase-related amidase
VQTFSFLSWSEKCCATRRCSTERRTRSSLRWKNLFPPDASKLISNLQPGHDEIVADKDRFCAFSGNDLKEVLRSGGIKHLVIAGAVTSGVILSTFTLAADEDYSMTILTDACADPKASLHEELMTNLFPRSAKVLTVDQWIASLPAPWRIGSQMREPRPPAEQWRWSFCR